jgi:hypothetical protein
LVVQHANPNPLEEGMVLRAGYGCWLLTEMTSPVR